MKLTRSGEAEMRTTFSRSFISKLNSGVFAASVAFAAATLAMVIAVSCGGGNTALQTSTTGMIQVSISDPPSCMPPNGQFSHVFITVRSVQAHTSATADASASGWQELAPQLAGGPMRGDPFSSPERPCILGALGPAG